MEKSSPRRTGGTFKLRVQRRAQPSRFWQSSVPVIAILFALLGGSLIAVLIGLNPLQIYQSMLAGIIQSRSGWIEVVLKTTPILLTSLGVGLAFRGSFWNIGAEGQIFLGAIASFGVASLLGEQPAWLVLPMVILAGFWGGAVWGMIPAWLKIKYRINEIVTTLMLNYVGQFLLFYLVHGPWKEPEFNYPWSWELPASAVLPPFLHPRLHSGILLALLMLLLVYVLDRYSLFGFENRVTGSNAKAASASGIKITKNMVILMAISGGLAGLAGMGEVCGLRYRLLEQISLGYGFVAITVALLGRLNPAGIAVASLFMGFMTVGGQYVQRAMNIPFSFIEALSALLVLGVLIARYLPDYRITFFSGEYEHDK